MVLLAATLTVTPAQGPIGGGTLVTLTGANLLGVTVQLDGAPVAPSSQSATEIRVVMPKHDSGYIVLSARNASGTSYGEFLYVPPALDALPPGFITTVAGIGTYVRDFGPALNAVVSPSGLALAKNGALYASEPLFGKVDRVNPDGTLERITHFGSAGLSSGDGGPALDAVISFPISLALDAAGNLYVPDHTYRIRRIDAASGIITTIAGDGIEGYSGDNGQASAARIGLPTHCTISGDNFFFIDFDAMRVRRIDLKSGVISAYAGGGAGFAGDGGPALNAKFDVGDSDRGALAADSHGNLFIGDSNNNRLRRVDAVSGNIDTFATANSIRALAVDANDNIYYAGAGGIVKLAPDGRVLATYAITGLVPGLAVEPDGNILFSDASASRLRRINVATRTIETVAGIGPAIIGENGPAIESMISPTDLLMQRDGSILFGDATLRIRKLDRNGNVSTIAGTGMNGGASYGAASSVTLAAVGLDADPLGNLDIPDASVVRRLRVDGVVEPLISRNPNCGYSGDGGLAVDATVCQPFETARDRNGNLFLADTNNNRIRRVDAQSGIITTIAGNGGRRNGFEGYGSGEDCGDGGPALDACINTPYGLAFDGAGNLFIAGESHIRKVNMLTGRIETFAANLHVTKLLFGFGGLLYGARFGGRLLRFEPGGAFTEIAGSNPVNEGIGDGGPASQALLRTAHQANGIAIDADGNLFLADQGNGRIRAIRYGAVLAPPGATIQASSSGSRITATVRDANGAPAPSVRIDYDVPTSGASCRPANPFAITDASGTATVVCTPNCVAGTYSITLRPVAGTSATIPVTNPSGPCRRHAL